MSRGVCTSVLRPDRGVGSEEMRTPEDVLEMRRLHGLGWGTQRIAAAFGGARTTVPLSLRWMRPSHVACSGRGSTATGERRTASNSVSRYLLPLT